MGVFQIVITYFFSDNIYGDKNIVWNLNLSLNSDTVKLLKRKKMFWTLMRTNDRHHLKITKSDLILLKLFENRRKRNHLMLKILITTQLSSHTFSTNCIHILWRYLALAKNGWHLFSWVLYVWCYVMYR